MTAAIANGMDYRYSYDRDGLLLAKKASGRTLLSYRYDELGRKISQTDITGRQVNYRFDKSNQLVDICNEFDQSIVSFARDADGAIQKITHANGMWQDIAYDADKNIVSLTVATPDKILAQNTYRYDGNGQRIEKNELTGQTLYTYDSLNRLEQAEYPAYTERFTYDQSGNRLTRTVKNIATYATFINMSNISPGRYSAVSIARASESPPFRAAQVISVTNSARL